MSGPDRRRTPLEDKVALAVAAAVVGGLFVAGALALRWLGAAVFGVFEAGSAGLGLRPAFLWGMGLSTAMMIVFALVAGDGIVGELPIMLIGFFAMTAFFTAVLFFVF